MRGENLNREEALELLDSLLDGNATDAQIAAILDVQLGDTVKARRILPDGTSERASALPALRSQERLWELTQPLTSGPDGYRGEFHASVINP